MSRIRLWVRENWALAVAQRAIRATCLCLVFVLCAFRCATTTQPEAAAANLSALAPAAEFSAPAQGTLQLENGVLANGTTATPCLSLLPDFQATDLVIEADVEFTGKGAPGLVFRASATKGSIRSMYVLALHAHGVTLWRLDDSGWTPIETHVFAVEPDVSHSLHAHVIADKIAVAYDGKQLFTAKDTFLDGPGHAGVRAVEGPCRFRSLRVSSLN